MDVNLFIRIMLIRSVAALGDVNLQAAYGLLVRGSLCVHRLRRVDTGLRNTDITNAHGLVIHGFLFFIYLILCAYGTDFKGFWRASSPRCLRSTTSDA